MKDLRYQTVEADVNDTLDGKSLSVRVDDGKERG